MSFISTSVDPYLLKRGISKNKSQDKETNLMTENLEKHTNSINSQTVR